MTPEGITPWKIPSTWEFSWWEFSRWEFTRGKFDWWKFPGWEFSLYRRKYMRRILKCTCTDIDLHQKNSPNPQSPCLVPTNNNFFLDGVEIFPHHLVQLTGHASALIGYIEM